MCGRCAKSLPERLRIMKKILVTSFLIVSLSCVAQNKYPRFILAFGNDFDNDSVSIIINKIEVAKNVKLKPTMISPQNLWIEQNNSALVVMPHNQPKVKFNKIQLTDSLLLLKVGLNNIWYSFYLDLRKGKALIAKYSYFRVGWSIRKFLTIEQTDTIIML